MRFGAVVGGASGGWWRRHRRKGEKTSGYDSAPGVPTSRHVW